MAFGEAMDNWYATWVLLGERWTWFRSEVLTFPPMRSLQSIEVNHIVPGVRTSWLKFPVLPFTSCVTVGKCLILSIPQFPHP